MDASSGSLDRRIQPKLSAAERDAGPEVRLNPGEFDFRIREPAPALRPYVRRIWFARGRVAYEQEAILPTPSVVMIVNLGDGFVVTVDDEPMLVDEAWVIGRQERAILNRPLGETHVVGVSFSGWGAFPYFGVPLAELGGRVIRLRTLGCDVSRLREELLITPDPDDKLVLLERHLEERLRQAATQSLLARAIDRLPGSSIRELAFDLGLSQKHLIALFRTWVGTTPKRAARIARFNRMLAALDPECPDWATLALDHGYYDQAHLNREFREIAGCTPTEYVDRRRRAYGAGGGGEETIFVPQ